MGNLDSCDSHFKDGTDYWATKYAELPINIDNKYVNIMIGTLSLDIVLYVAVLVILTYIVYNLLIVNGYFRRP